MKIKYYEDADLLSIRLSEKSYYTAAEQGGIIVHYTKQEEPVLIEVLNARQFIKDLERLLPTKIKSRPSSKQDVVVSVPHRIK